MKKERDLEALRQMVYADKHKKEASHRAMKKKIREYENQYAGLQETRKREVSAALHDLRSLHNEVTHMEIRLLEESRNPFRRTGGGSGAGAAEAAAFSGGGKLGDSSALLRVIATHSKALKNMPPPPVSSGSEMDENFNNSSAGMGMKGSGRVRTATSGGKSKVKLAQSTHMTAPPPPPPAAFEGGLSGMEVLQNLTSIGNRARCGEVLTRNERDLLLLSTRLKQLQLLADT